MTDAQLAFANKHSLSATAGHIHVLSCYSPATTCLCLMCLPVMPLGIDMTDAQLVFANKHSTAWQQQLGYSQPNMQFVKGAIEQLEAAGIPAGGLSL